VVIIGLVTLLEVTNLNAGYVEVGGEGDTLSYIP
jgi:hypothetical protein